MHQCRIISKVFMVSIAFFLGACRLSGPCKRVGLRALPLDKDPQRSENMVAANFDLANPSQFSSLRDLIHVEKEFIIHAHFAPSCGTASRCQSTRRTETAEIRRAPGWTEVVRSE